MGGPLDWRGVIAAAWFAGAALRSGTPPDTPIRHCGRIGPGRNDSRSGCDFAAGEVTRGVRLF